MKILLIILLCLCCAVSVHSTHYDVLQVRHDAGEDVIKKSYRELAKKYHPDKNKADPNAQDKFIAIGAAYEVLSDPQKRREYDLSLHQPPHRRGENFGDSMQRQHFHHRGGRGHYTFHFQNGRGGSSFQHFENSYELPQFVGMILGGLLLVLPFALMFAPLFFIWLILWICGYRSSSRRDDNDTEDAREKLSTHWQRDYIPDLTRRGMLSDRRIIIAALTSDKEVIESLRQSKVSYSRDPVYFAKCNRAISSSFKVIALCKQGKKYCLLSPDSNINTWIESILNGESGWKSIESLPSDIRLNVS